MTAWEQMTDGELAAAVAKGRREAAQALVLRHQGVVRGFLRRLTPDAALADDLAQETFLRALKHADRFDDHYAMRSWLLTIAKRLLINHVRRTKRETLGGEFDRYEHGARTPLQVASQADQQLFVRQRLAAAMQHLTEAQRATMKLFHHDQMSIQEVADTLRLPVGTVKSHLYRARLAMRSQLCPSLQTID